MATFGRVDAGVIVNAIMADQEYIDTLPDAADWVALPFGVGVGWSYDGVDFTDENGNPPPERPEAGPRYLLTGSEWVLTFTDAEWAWMKVQRTSGTAAGDQLDQFMDAIRWTDSIDVSSTNVDPFYDWLLTNGIPGGQGRIDELRSGIEL